MTRQAEDQARDHAAILKRRFPYIQGLHHVNRPVTVHWFDVLKALDEAALSPLATDGAAVIEQCAKVLDRHAASCLREAEGLMGGMSEFAWRRAAEELGMAARAIRALTPSPVSTCEGEGPVAEVDPDGSIALLWPDGQWLDATSSGLITVGKSPSNAAAAQQYKLADLALPTPPADSRSEDRETIARIVDPEAFVPTEKYPIHKTPAGRRFEKRRREARAKADQILALRQIPASSNNVGEEG